jgi:hypothetical protein
LLLQTSNQSALKPGFTPPPLLSSVSPQSSAPLIALRQPAAAMAINGQLAPGRRSLPSSPYKNRDGAPAPSFPHQLEPRTSPSSRAPPPVAPRPPRHWWPVRKLVAATGPSRAPEPCLLPGASPEFLDIRHPLRLLDRAADGVPPSSSTSNRRIDLPLYRLVDAIVFARGLFAC